MTNEATRKPRVITPVQPSASAAAAQSEVRTAPANEVLITRLINAPREMVFDAWLSHEHLANWFGPEGFTITTRSIDVRTGGEWHFTMHGPDGVDYINHVFYTEVKRPERIAYRHTGGGDTEAIRFETEVTFVDVGGNTELSLRSIFPSAEERDFVVAKYGAIEGGKQTLGRLATYIERAE